MYTMAPPIDCIVCFKPIPSDGKYMSCTSCTNFYHLGQTCSGVSDGTFIAMGQAKRDKWRCRTCRSGDARSGSANATSQGDGDSVATHLAAIDTKLQSLLSLKSSVDSLLSLPAKVDQLLELRPTVELLKETVNEVQKSINFLSGKYDQLLATTTANEKAVSILQAETSSLKQTVSEQASVINSLQTELNEGEQYSRLSNLEIHGMPPTAGEDLNGRVHDLAAKLGLPLPQPGEVLAVHRLPARPGSIPVVLIRFSSIYLRDTWLNARARLRALREGGSLSRIFFNENLTRVNKELFWKARARGREKSYRFVWVKHGKIYAKKLEGAPLVKLNCASDLEKLS